jgi:mono/diheme cytochrome c family protein
MRIVSYIWHVQIRPTPILIILALAATAFGARAADATATKLDGRFDATVKPFLQTYCVTCHGGEKTEAGLNLAGFSSMAAAVKDQRRLGTVLDRLQAEDMPPSKAKLHPTTDVRKQAVDWFRTVVDYEARLNAGDPGVVLARRLSNSEYDYTIRDLTGFDIKPTREFPADPSNIAGFDNSGESLVMSPSLLNKYLAAARDVASHMFLKPSGFSFAPYPMLVETDRDKFCVQQIINLYHQQDINYADYFQAAWRFKNRAVLGKPKAKLADFAADSKISAKYLSTIWTTLEGKKEDVGPLVKLQSMWAALPVPDANQTDVARTGCEQMRDYVVQLRKKVEARFLNINAGRVNGSREPMEIWKNVQYATHRRTFDPAQLQIDGTNQPAPSIVEPDTANQFGPGKTVLVVNKPGDPDLFVPADQRAKYEAAFAKFSSVFPDMFYKEQRGRNYFDASKDQGRYLSAGFHNVMGYFRDDQALYELILDNQQQKQLDEMWHEMDFVAKTTERMYGQFASFGEAVGNVANTGTNDVDENPAALPEDKEITSEPKIKALEKKYLAMAQGGNPVGIKAVRDYFENINDTVRWVEKARVDAEPSQLQQLLKFAECAYRRPLTKDEQNDLVAYYHSLRDKDGLSHEEAMRESIVSVLMSPDMTYRIDLVAAGKGIQPLSDYDLASRLSYFLWSSMPDEELLARAAAGDLHKPKVIAAQAQRMLKDPRIRGLALEFGGNWLDFRHFEEINTVDLTKFPDFNNGLKEAMFEEPVRFLTDVFQNNRSILDCLYANDTFVNPVLAKNYGIPVTGIKSNDWVHVADAGQYDRGGILPMAVFLTKNAPGLRTSPVKRGNWVVKNVLGERIPPPPPVVPELPRDEAKMDLPLREMLARHRADPNCAACHARFDSMGLVFEGFGLVGERREKDLAGRAIDPSATFPGGMDGTGLAGLRQYIRDKRQDDFVNNFCGKLLAFALGRSLIFSDDMMIHEMCVKLDKGYQFDTMIDSIVTSPQFLNKRGHDDLNERKVSHEQEPKSAL